MANDNVVRVFVFRQGDRYLVRPACPSARAGDTIEWVNFTDQPIEILIPRLHRLGLEGGVIDGKGGLKETLKGGVPGAYPFAVYLQRSAAFAEGNSHPTFIIEP